MRNGGSKASPRWVRENEGKMFAGARDTHCRSSLPWQGFSGRRSKYSSERIGIHREKWGGNALVLEPCLLHPAGWCSSPAKATSSVLVGPGSYCSWDADPTKVGRRPRGSAGLGVHRSEDGIPSSPANTRPGERARATALGAGVAAHDGGGKECATMAPYLPSSALPSSKLRAGPQRAMNRLFFTTSSVSLSPGGCPSIVFRGGGDGGDCVISRRASSPTSPFSSPETAVANLFWSLDGTVGGWGGECPRQTNP